MADGEARGSGGGEADGGTGDGFSEVGGGVDVGDGEGIGGYLGEDGSDGGGEGEVFGELGLRGDCGGCRRGLSSWCQRGGCDEGMVEREHVDDGGDGVSEDGPLVFEGLKAGVLVFPLLEFFEGGDLLVFFLDEEEGIGVGSVEEDGADEEGGDEGGGYFRHVWLLSCLFY